MRRSYSIYLLLALAILAVVGFLYYRNATTPAPPGDTPSATRQLRVLAWVGYEEPEIVDPFEKEFGVDVLTETFTGADKMFAKLSADPDAYDLVVIDPEYIEKLYDAGLLQPLDKSEFDFEDYIDPLKNFPLCSINGEYWAVLIRFGINAIVYNTEELTQEEVDSYSVLWTEKVRGRVGIWDWYLPNMGVLSLALGHNPPYASDDEKLGKLQERLRDLRPQVKAIMGSFSDINAAFARGDIWLAPALGEHTAAVLSEDGHPIDWHVPREGAIMWIETLGIPKNARNVQDAKTYIKYFQRPDVQAKLTWRRAYRSNMPSVAGIELLTKVQQDALKVHSSQEAEELVDSVHVRLLPETDSGESAEGQWQGLWQEFKADSL